MASYSAAVAVHKTTGVATVDTVTLTDNGSPIEVINRGTVDPLHGRAGLTPANSVTDPTVGGDDTFVVPPGGVRTIKIPGASTGTDYVVKLIAASATAYSVQAGGQ